MAEVPKAVAELDAERRIWVVVECPRCGRRQRHQHGAGGPGDDPLSYLGARVAHCGGLPGTYELIDAGTVFCPRPRPTPDRVQRERIRRAARASGLRYRIWRRDYGERTTPLTNAERQARGDTQQLARASGW